MSDQFTGEYFRVEDIAPRARWRAGPDRFAIRPCGRIPSPGFSTGAGEASIHTGEFSCLGFDNTRSGSTISRGADGAPRGGARRLTWLEGSKPNAHG